MLHILKNIPFVKLSACAAALLSFGAAAAHAQYTPVTSGGNAEEASMQSVYTTSASDVRVSMEEQGVSVPLTMPGYELRSLDVTKKVVFHVGEKQVTGQVPILIYVPTGSGLQGDTINRLRRVYNDMVRLAKDSGLEEYYRDEIRTLALRLNELTADLAHFDTTKIGN